MRPLKFKSLNIEQIYLQKIDQKLNINVCLEIMIKFENFQRNITSSLISSTTTTLRKTKPATGATSCTRTTSNFCDHENFSKTT